MDGEEIVAAIIERGEEILIAQRPPGRHLAGKWEFPGGKVAPGESHAACLARECREELGIEIEPGPLVDRTEYAYPNRRVVLHFYRCRYVSGEPRPLASERIQWVRPEDLSSDDFPEANAAVVARLKLLHRGGDRG